MSKENEQAEAAESQRPPIMWREVPTVIGEQIVGHAVAGAMHRFVIGEIGFNPEPGASSPILKPNVTIAIPHLLLPSLIQAMANAYEGVQKQLDGKPEAANE